MKTASAALAAYLQSTRELLFVDLLEVTTSLGGTLYCASVAGSYSVFFDPGDPTTNAWHARGTYTYDGSTLGFTRGKVSSQCGLQVDTLDLTLWNKGGYTIGGIGLVQAAMNGLLDGASVTLMRLFMPTWGDTSLGVVWSFGGVIAEQQVSANSIKCTVKSTLQQLDKQMPRNLGQPGCLNTIYDTACGVNQGTYTSSGNSTLTGSTYSVTLNSIVQVDGYYDQGILVCTSGNNTGATRTVKHWVSRVAQLHKPLLYAPQTGDHWTIAPGCDGTLGTNGCPKFSNTARFRGLPFIPVPENMIP